MPDWYFQNQAAASDGPHSEQAFPGFIRSGAVTADTLVWTDGMEQWAPARASTWASHFQQPATSSPPPMPPAMGHSSAVPGNTLGGDYKKPGLIAGIVVVLLALTLFCDFDAAVITSFQIELLGRIQSHGHYTMAEIHQLDALASMIVIARATFFLLTVIFFARWVYVSAKNVRAFGAKYLEFTPGWAVGYYFVPIACLWMPYQAMREIWLASSSPHSWQRESAGPIPGLWWTFWITGNILAQIATQFSNNIKELVSINTQLWIILSSRTVCVILSILAIILVRTIARRQAATAARLQAGA